MFLACFAKLYPLSLNLVTLMRLLLNCGIMLITTKGPKKGPKWLNNTESILHPDERTLCDLPISAKTHQENKLHNQY